MPFSLKKDHSSPANKGRTFLFLCCFILPKPLYVSLCLHSVSDSRIFERLLHYSLNRPTQQKPKPECKYFWRIVPLPITLNALPQKVIRARRVKVSHLKLTSSAVPRISIKTQVYEGFKDLFLIDCISI